MTAIRTTIRPRTRANALETPHQPPEQDMPSLPLLARLPNVSLVADKGKLAIRLDWLKQLDWKKMRQLRLDPNWVAGGVLSLVLLLLVVITLNRGSKPSASSPDEIEAPAFQGAAMQAQASHSASIGQSGLAKQAGSSTPDSTSHFNSPAGQGSSGPTTGFAPSQAVADSNRASLEGIYYPCTPHGTHDSNVLPATAHATGYATPPSGYENGIRTAQREPFASRRPQPLSSQQGYVQPAHAQLDGFITQPQGTRNP